MHLFLYGFAAGIVVGAFIGWVNMRLYHEQVKAILIARGIVVKNPKQPPNH